MTRPTWYSTMTPYGARQCRRYMHIYRTLTLIASASLIAGCVLTYSRYVPRVEPQRLTVIGGCPTQSPAMSLTQPDLPWFWIKIFMWDELEQKSRGQKDPTFGFFIMKREKFFDKRATE